jgi:hypothetical protein
VRVKNVGDGHSGPTGFGLDCHVNGDEVGDGRVAFGPSAGQVWPQQTKRKLDRAGDSDVRVVVTGIDNESDYDELAGLVHQERSDPKATLANSAEQVMLASQTIRAVHGDDELPGNFSGINDNGRDDDYRGYFDDAGWTVLAGSDPGGYLTDIRDHVRFRPRGLYEGRYDDAFGPGGWDAQALLL